MELGSRRLYAWVAKDFEGVETVVSTTDRRGNSVPLVSISPKVAKLARGAAIKAGNNRRETVRLVEYVEAAVLDEVDP